MSQPSAIILIEAERSAMPTIGHELASIPGVSSVLGVTGEWDFVVIVDASDHDQLRSIISRKVTAVGGVARTQTLVALETYEDGGTA